MELDKVRNGKKRTHFPPSLLRFFASLTFLFESGRGELREAFTVCTPGRVYSVWRNKQNWKILFARARHIF